MWKGWKPTPTHTPEKLSTRRIGARRWHCHIGWSTGQSAIFGMSGIDPYGRISPKTFGRFYHAGPHRPEPLADILSRTEENVMPYPMGNVHPRF